jgi:hypothetical protein
VNIAVTVPVLLIIFNRPEMTRRALEAISRAKPETLLVVADGARFPEEVGRCEQARELIKSVDWECDVRTDFSDINLGCGIRVCTGIDWAMSQFEELIILEDDCVPSASFFKFCEELLDYYRNDERVMHISGNNFQQGIKRTEHSYYFSKVTHAWGWATWKRAWEHFDWEMKSWPEFKSEGLLESWCDDEYELKYWTDIFDETYAGAPDIWDYRWNYACLSQNGLSLIPSKNLVTNVGTGLDATHTQGEAHFMNLPTEEINQINHPPFVVRHKAADGYTFAHNFGGDGLRQAHALPARLKKKLRPVSFPIRAARKLWRMASS